MKNVVAGFVLLFCIACSGKRMPSDVLPKKEMQKVMWDMIQADQYYREFVERDSLTKDVKKERYALYEEVFKMHKISRATFDKSFDYYSTHPQLMKEMFDSMSAQGSRNLTSFYRSPASDTTSLRRTSDTTSLRRTGDTTLLRKPDSIHNRMFRPRRDSIKAQ